MRYRVCIPAVCILKVPEKLHCKANILYRRGNEDRVMQTTA